MTGFGGARVLEIGPKPFIAGIGGARAKFFDARPRQDRVMPVAAGCENIRLRDVPEALREADLVVVADPPPWGPWNVDTLVRTLFSRSLFSSRYRPAAPFVTESLRFARARALAVVDLSDSPYVESGQLYLLRRSTLYFKRELPPDEWRLLTKTATARHPSRRFRSKRAYRDLLDKVRPISLGPTDGAEADLPTDPVAKASDIFYAGTTGGVPVRERVIGELRRLAEEGVVIDMPDGPLPRKEFFRRCAAARITLSPEGLGWDCYRHYEAALCGSVPLMNYPGILRHAPFTDGVNALFYPPEEGGFSSVARRALADRAALTAMGEAARSHARAYHTHEALARYVVDSTLAAASSARK